MDDLILFHPLQKDELRRIVTLQLRRIEQRLTAQKIGLVVTEGAIDHIAQVGYDPVYGARPLKRALQKELENPIATLILEESVTAGSVLQVTCEAGSLSFTPLPPGFEG